MARWIIIVLVLVLVTVVAAARLRASEPVTVAPAVRGPISAYVEERAKTRLPRVWRITMPIDGRLPIDLVEGDAVRAGEVVAQLDMADLETAVAVVLARVARLQARIVENNDARLETSTLVELAEFLESVDRSVEAAMAKTEASRAREAFHGRHVARKRQAFEKSSVSPHELEEAELAELESAVEYRTDRLELSALEAIRRAAQIWPLQVRQVIEKKALTEAALEHELAEARASLEQAVRDRERSVVRSPVDGVVLERVVSDRRALPAGAGLLEIGRLDDLEIEAEVLSQEAMKVRVDDPVDVIMPARPGPPLRGRVVRIEPRGFTRVSSLGVEQQRVLVIVALDDEVRRRFQEDGDGPGVGFRVRVRFHTDVRDDAVVIPRSALFRGVADRWQAFVVRSGRARLVDLRLGLGNDREVQVLDGIDAGEEVVLAPETELRDGLRVRAVP